MSKINEKLGLRPAGKRSMMKLPTDRAEAIALTAAQCPACQARGVRQNNIHGVLTRLCSWCGHVWEPTAAEVRA